MFFVQLLRYLRGYVHFKAEGVFVERFLNLAARDHIAIWNGRKKGIFFTACTSVRGYKKLRRHAKKSGVRIRVVQKQGMPFQKRKYRKRKGLLIGLVFFFAILGVMSRMIWRIEVAENPHVREEHVLQALDELGIRVGIWRSSIDVRASERLLLLKLGEVSWIALNIDGSTIYVEMNDATMPPENFVDVNTPCNIVAARSGQIVSMRVYEGQPLLQEGDSVLEGDIIVSGIKEDRLGQNIFKHALAEVMAQVQHTIEIEVPLSQTEFIPTGGVVRRRYLRIGDKGMPLFYPYRIKAPFTVEREAEPLRFLGMELPLVYATENYLLMEEMPVILTEEQAKGKALQELEVVQKSQLPGAVIEERVLTASVKNDTFVLTAQYVCRMDIAREQAIVVDEGLEIK